MHASEFELSFVFSFLTSFEKCWCVFVAQLICCVRGAKRERCRTIANRTTTTLYKTDSNELFLTLHSSDSHVLGGGFIWIYRCIVRSKYFCTIYSQNCVLLEIVLKRILSRIFLFILLALEFFFFIRYYSTIYF